MPRTTTTMPVEVAALVAHAALGQQVLDLVKASGLAKPKRRKRRATNGHDEEPPVRRKRRSAIRETVERATKPRESVRTDPGFDRDE